MKKIILAMALFLGSLGAANAQTTIKNGGLENWRTSKLLFNLTASLETPQGWSSFDSVFNIINFISGQNTRVTTQVKKSTAIKNSGLSSAQVTTSNYSDLGLMPGYLTNAKLNVNANFDFNFSFDGFLFLNSPFIFILNRNLTKSLNHKIISFILNLNFPNFFSISAKNMHINI
jgi:hypothetical protein